MAAEGIKGATATEGGVVELPHPLRRTVEHVYLTDSGGTPLVHLSRTLPSDKDPDLVASMFTAIQNFMDDSFHSRSEEHTSELQSHSDLVCRLLLEKKKKKRQQSQISALHYSTVSTR